MTTIAEPTVTVRHPQLRSRRAGLYLPSLLQRAGVHRRHERRAGLVDRGDCPVHNNTQKKQK